MKRYIPFMKADPRVAVVRLQGAISSGPRGSLSDEAMAQTLERAFRRGKPDAVALIVNSPGGSPVQSSLIGARIRRLADEHEVPVHAFVEDLAASGGYWLAAAADHIWVDETSIVGSIGVISAGFGLSEFLDRHGIERRVHTSGESKSFMDPFRPEKPEDVARLETLLEEIHDSFKDHIRARRGSRLADDPELFSGKIWVGQSAVKVGLADGIAHVVPKMKAIFGDKVKFVRYGPRRGLLSRFGANLAADVIAGVEERLTYSRYGL